MSADGTLIVRRVLEAIAGALDPVPDTELPARSGLVRGSCQVAIGAAEDAGYVAWSRSPPGWVLLPAGWDHIERAG